MLEGVLDWADGFQVGTGVAARPEFQVGVAAGPEFQPGAGVAAGPEFQAGVAARPEFQAGAGVAARPEFQAGVGLAREFPVQECEVGFSKNPIPFSFHKSSQEEYTHCLGEAYMSPIELDF